MSLKLTYGEPSAERMTVHADREKMLQALLNVVANATRHARRKIEIRIAAEKDGVVIKVADDGGGISTGAASALVPPFC
ncbi:ATP-binding protein [Paenibacillus doosanensis]|uniref:ATP-binding protein n=1 Tax=Paenibacillus TaxID=44249 RepID=UPI00201E25EF|nr:MULTISPECIES: ATP-binding protein [Paenibacillus]MCS7460467.1 ATP-binding protein [Paenibacillus doosanensis]